MTEKERREKVAKMNDDAKKKADNQFEKIRKDMESGKITRKQAYDKLSKIKVTFSD